MESAQGKADTEMGITTLSIAEVFVRERVAPDLAVRLRNWMPEATFLRWV